MRRVKSGYVLDSREETERLERQSRMKAFDFEDELRFLPIVAGQKIMDAGCGSGIVSDYLSKRAPGVEVVGCDFSKDRVVAANAKYGSAPNLQFIQRNLLESNPRSGEFDVVVCRYVLRHLNPVDGKKALQNLFDALKPGGTLYCIDVEGVMGDIYPASSFLRASLRKIREAKSVDFQVARKLPVLLSQQGLKNVAWHALVSEFKGPELDQELVNLEQALDHADSFLKQVLGGANRLARFRREYFSTLREQAGCVLFYNRVIASGTKPGPALQLVR